MASLVNHLKSGVILRCTICTGYIKEVYFTHLCEFNPSRVLNGISPKVYCFQCLTEKEKCKMCNSSYLAKSASSL